MKKALLVFACLLSLCLSAIDVVYQNPLSDSIANLKKAGWSIPKGIESLNGVLQITATGGERNFATYNLPVQAGKCYGGSIKVKLIDVKARNNLDRGATFFFGLLNKDRHWVNGGEFPRGPYGKGGDWRTVDIPISIAIPDSVKYIQIWVCIEGQGVAQFKDLEVHVTDLNSEWAVDASSNPPKFTYSALPGADKMRLRPIMRFLVSQNPQCPDDDTAFAAIAGASGKFTFPHALKPGKWHVKAQWAARQAFAPMKAEFTIGDIPENAPVKITQLYKSGAYTPAPELAFKLYPVVPKDIAATINGKPMTLKSSAGDTVVFTPAAQLTAGIYDIVVKAGGRSYPFLLVNKNPAHNFSFRDDKMLLMDGKPFFPIGTYRDPSDDLTCFDGIMEAGFNLTHSYAFENANVTPQMMTSYLKDCEQHGVYAFMGIPRKHIIGNNGLALQKHCAAMYDQKGLLSLYLADEPELWVNQYSMKNGADAVGAACPGVPRILLLCTPSEENQTVKYLGNGLSEIFWHDPYPIPRAPITTVKNSMMKMRRVSQGKQSLWCVIQAFDWDQHAVKEKKYEDVEPKAGKIRCMTHLALAADVQGIVYYWLPRDRYNMRHNSPIQWAETVACARELNTLYPFLIGRNAPQDIKLPEGVDYWCRKAEDGRYALGIINTTDKVIEVDVNVLSFKKKLTLYPWDVQVLK